MTKKSEMEKLVDGFSNLIFDTIHEPLLVLDYHLKIISANPAFYDTFQVKPNVTIGKNIYDLGNHQWDIPQLRKLLGEILPKHKTIQKYEVEHIFPQIGKKIMLLNGRQIDNIQIILLAIEDITQRKKVEDALIEMQKKLEAKVNNQTIKLQEINKKLYSQILVFKQAETKLKESEILYKTLTNTSPEAVTSTDLKGRITYVSPQTLVLHGFKKPEELLGRNAVELIAPNEHKAALGNLQKTLKYGKVSNLEYRMLKKDGSSFFGEVHTAVIKDSSNNPKGFITTVRDITSRRKTEKDLINHSIMLENTKKALLNMMEDLTEIKARDEAMLASIGDGLVMVDNQMRITFINHAAEEAVGYKNLQLIGKIWNNIIQLKTENYIRMPINESPLYLALYREIKTISKTFFYTRKDRSMFPVAITVSPVLLDKKVIGAIIVFRDITKETDIDRAKSEFVSLASHQLRTPLTAISWSAEMLLSGEAESPQPGQKQYLEDIYNSNKRMINLVNALLNVSRIELDTLDIHPEKISITKIINNLLSEFISIIENKNLRIVKHYKESLPCILADPKLLRIILQNLLSNAMNYSREKGKVEITIKKKDRQFVFTVSDNGIGIPKYAQEKIFTKLYRADNAQIHIPDGTGLGLYIVKAVVEQSDGRIWFESKENKGTKFYFSLPTKGMKKKKGLKSLIV